MWSDRPDRGEVALVSCSVIGWFLRAAGWSQDGSDGDGRQLAVEAVDLSLLSFSLRDGKNKDVVRTHLYIESTTCAYAAFVLLTSRSR